MAKLEQRGVPVLLPASWLRAPSRLRVNLTATSGGPVGRSSGFLSTTALATFDWRLAIGDAVLRCPTCLAHYDVRRAGACLDAPELHLDPLPLLVNDDVVSVAVPASVTV